MFEEELELERKEGGGFGPLLVILALVAIVVGGIGYMVWQGTRTLKPDEATKIVSAALQQRGPSVIRFQSGKLTYNNTIDSITDPQYKLLQKLGIVTTKSNKDGAIVYTVPLARRQFVSLEKVTRLSPSSAEVIYTWKWQPNELGKDFDASGPAVQAFSTYERSVLIQKYGADFYSAEPQRVIVKLVKLYDGWHFATE